MRRQIIHLSVLGNQLHIFKIEIRIIMMQLTMSTCLRINHVRSPFGDGAEIPVIIYQSGDEMNGFIPALSLAAYFCCIDIKTLRSVLMPLG